MGNQNIRLKNGEKPNSDRLIHPKDDAKEFFCYHFLCPKDGLFFNSFILSFLPSYRIYPMRLVLIHVGQHKPLCISYDIKSWVSINVRGAYKRLLPLKFKCIWNHPYKPMEDYKIKRWIEKDRLIGQIEQSEEHWRLNFQQHPLCYQNWAPQPCTFYSKS